MNPSIIEYSKASTRNDDHPKKSLEIEKEQDSVSDSETSSNCSSSKNNHSGNSTRSSTPLYMYSINPPPVGRPVRIYCDGIFDLFHFGHAKALEQAKKAFPDVYLIVGVCDDILTHSRKGKTVMTDKERYESLRHCKWVDEVVEAAPWIVDQAFLDKYQIDYVAHDDIPYKSIDSDDVYAFVKSAGRFLPTNRTDGVSTSDLITRIVKDYDRYLQRNLDRGVTAKELGIGFLKEKEVKFKKSAEDIRSSIQQSWNEARDELIQALTAWEDKSQEFVKETFGVDSVVNKIFHKSSIWPLRISRPASITSRNSTISVNSDNSVSPSASLT